MCKPLNLLHMRVSNGALLRIHWVICLYVIWYHNSATHASVQAGRQFDEQYDFMSQQLKPDTWPEVVYKQAKMEHWRRVWHCNVQHTERQWSCGTSPHTQSQCDLTESGLGLIPWLCNQADRPLAPIIVHNDSLGVLIWKKVDIHRSSHRCIQAFLRHQRTDKIDANPVFKGNALIDAWLKLASIIYSSSEPFRVLAQSVKVAKELYAPASKHASLMQEEVHEPRWHKHLQNRRNDEDKKAKTFF